MRSPDKLPVRRPRWPGVVGRVGLWLGVLAIVAFAFAFGELPPDSLFVVLAVQPINLLALLFVALRFRALSGGSVPLWPSTKAAALSSSLLYVFPTRISEFVKPVYLAAQCNLSLLRGTALLAMERFIDVLIVASLLGLGALLLANDQLGSALLVWGSIASAVILVCLAVLFCPDRIQSVASLLPSQWLKDVAARFVDEMRLTVSPDRIVLAFFWSSLAWMASFVVVHIVINASGSVPLTQSQSFLVFMAGTVGIAAAVVPGGLGTFEAAIVVSLAAHGYTVGEALALSVLLRAANLGFVPLLAAWTIVRDGVGLAALAKEIQKLREQVRN